MSFAEDFADPELRALVEAYERQSAEWQAIADELTRAGKQPTAYKVTREQRKRQLARGERPVDVERLIELGNREAEASAGARRP